MMIQYSKALKKNITSIFSFLCVCISRRVLGWVGFVSSRRIQKVNKKQTQPKFLRSLLTFYWRKGRTTGVQHENHVSAVSRTVLHCPDCRRMRSIPSYYIYQHLPVKSLCGYYVFPSTRPTPEQRHCDFCLSLILPTAEGRLNCLADDNNKYK